MTRLIVTNDLNHHGDAIDGTYTVSCGPFELTGIYWVNSPRAAAEVYAEGNHLDIDDCEVINETLDWD